MKIATLVGMTSSTCLLIRDVWDERSAFCSHQLGCDRVATAAREWLPEYIDLPVVGIAGFAAALMCLVIDRPLARIGLGVSCVVGGVVGIGLVIVQVLALGETCGLCLSADLSGVSLAVLAFRGNPVRLISTTGTAGLDVARWTLLGATAAVAPWVWQLLVPPVPSAVWEEYRRHRVFGVVFTNVSCPHCQTVRRRVGRILSKTGKDVNSGIKFYHCPRRDDAWSQDAALASILAEREGKGSEFALALGRLPPVAESTESVLARFGIQRREVNAAKEELRQGLRLRRELGITELPTLFLGNARFVGEQSMTVLRRAIERAPLDQEGDSRKARVVFLIILAIWTALILCGRLLRAFSAQTRYRNPEPLHVQ